MLTKHFLHVDAEGGKLEICWYAIFADMFLELIQKGVQYTNISKNVMVNVLFAKDMDICKMDYVYSQAMFYIYTRQFLLGKTDCSFVSVAT